MADPRTLLVARVHGTAGGAARLLTALGRLRDAALLEDGCLSFDVLEVPGDRGELVVLGAFRDDAALRAHFSSAAQGRYVDEVADLLARPSDAAIHTVAATRHPVGDLSTEPRRAD